MLIKEKTLPTTDTQWGADINHVEASFHDLYAGRSVCFIDVFAGSVGERGLMLRCDNRSDADKVWGQLIESSDVKMSDLRDMGFVEH